MLKRQAPVHSSRLIRASDALMNAINSDPRSRALTQGNLDRRFTGGTEFTRTELEEAMAFLVRLGFVAEEPPRTLPRR